MGWQLRLDWKCSLTVGINRWLCITDTIQTMICVSTVSTTVTSIKVAICIVHFIIAETIRYQFLWTITVLWIAYTVSTNLCVDIRSTTIASIIVAFCDIYMIITITIIYTTRGLTALKLIKNIVCFILFHQNKSITYSLIHLLQSRNKQVQVQLCL